MRLFVPLFVLFLMLTLPTRTLAAPYTGPLFDTHFHLDEVDANGQKVGGAPIETVVENMKKNGVETTLGLVFIDTDHLSEQLQQYGDLLKKYNSRKKKFVFFFQERYKSPKEFTPASILPAVEQGKSVFRGFGELALARPQWRNANPDDMRFFDVYSVLEANGKMVMIHPTKDQKVNVVNALAHDPKLTFLFNGFEAENYIADLMPSHQNFLYTLDASTIIRKEAKPGPGLMFTARNKDEFLKTFDENFDPMLNMMVEAWKPKIEANPDRFLWGTDVNLSWQHDPDVYDRLIKFSRAFIGELSPRVQEKFAYQNAEGYFEPSSKTHLPAISPAQIRAWSRATMLLIGIGIVVVLGLVSFVIWRVRKRAQ